MKIDIENAFNTTGYRVYEFYQRPGVGFYIPLYQREYSWDKDNIDQLKEDIGKGVMAMIEHDDEIRFLGTIITVSERDRKRIQPQDVRALPATIERIIDGQQRLTTISMIASVLHKYLVEIENKLPKSSENREELLEITKVWRTKLIDLFSLDMGNGKPTRKPKIIRGYVDHWIREGNTAIAYKSAASKYFADYIESLENADFSMPKSTEKNNFTLNLAVIDRWIKNEVFEAHRKDDDNFPKAWEIIKEARLQEYIWSYERTNIVEIIERKDFSNKRSDDYYFCALVQIISVCHYLLDRCCFTTIQPMDENWAFDMFQSLNASGTPLTAIETFRPSVVNTTELNHIRFEDSEAKRDFAKIEELFKDMNSAAAKSKLTNEFLTSFAIVVDAYRLESHFSSQRKYLERIYDKELSDYESQCKFVRFFANYSEFYKKVWVDYKGDNFLTIEKINTNTEAELASVLISFLKKSNHRMAITLLGYFYNDILEGKADSISNFVNAVKTISAFYILWRSAESNAGLDNVYRNFFKGKEGEVDVHSWLETKGKSVDIQELKTYFRNVLIDRKLEDKETWIRQAASYLRYDTGGNICRIALLIASHDTISDDSNPGLMKIGTRNVAPYLKLEKWLSDDLKEIEHIAPKEPSGNWDEKLYDLNTRLYDSLGNLTLLPKAINISASNREWIEKSLYYRHLAEKDPDKVSELSINASNKGIDLNPSTIEMLQKANFNHHILPIIQISDTQNWDSQIVEKRTIRILELVWDKVIDWL